MTSINLLNLARIGQLDPVPFSAELVQRLRDAELTKNSDETRFDCAYTTIRIVADTLGPHHCNGGSSRKTLRVPASQSCISAS